MALSAWPTSLPELPLHSGYNRTRQSGLIRDDNYNGLVNVRRRFTAITKYHTISVVMTKTQYLAFINFYDFTIGGGTLAFSYVNPIYQLGNIKVRIKADDPPYTVKFDTSTLDYYITFTLEELPGTVITTAYDEYKVTSEGEEKITSEFENKVTEK